ncbi:chromosome condensation complex Condensin subunit H [Encephalitozoon intestinalis ATCC 50506]|uniref:Condensin complex subunit 2 n=1 Tax=Encephalitozoon intestinalis (strain ATCC 50506) TaxID=876142 RepID=E0S5Y7_ENCIT|nr:chromosome condensation complex Condensin subunit H [Encephalitozoon intestinalis ATCC 50506]ADM11122.1 chromosome condensation complex Condensin subunit H [Encephalitozoon intestinalis ATCC 50506]UTX44776.1 chromosome condensation complex condensin subunit 2 [Encephalitozoon intestinalis]
MSNDDLGTWLKAAAENKITTKNTWKSTLIDHFTNIDEFREKQGINFQKASFTLDGCAKVYSTRVDDVSENAMRLLEGFGREEGKKRQAKKNKTTIEKNILNLNIKVSASRRLVDPKFLYLSSLAENALMIDALGISSDGMFRMTSSRDWETVVVDDLKLSVNLPQGLQISPSINEDKEIKDIIIDPIVGNDDESSGGSGGFGIDNHPDFSEFPPTADNQNLAYKETSFSYFKGWAGPNHWKVQAKKGKGGSQKPKETSFLDFTEIIDHEGILEAGNTLFEPSLIVERRENHHVLPQDFRLEVEDLYRYLVRDGLFHRKDQSHMDEISFDYSPDPCIVEEPEDEFITDAPSQGNQRSTVPLRKTSKKINIKKLKDNVFDFVREGSTSLLSIFKSVPKIYDSEESKDISMHLCFISLLHLANEKNIQLKDVGDDVKVWISPDSRT